MPAPSFPRPALLVVGLIATAAATVVALTSSPATAADPACAGATCPTDIWAGREEWTRFEAATPFPWDEQREWVFGLDYCPPVEQGTAFERFNSSSFQFSIGKVGPFPDNASTGLVLAAWAHNVVRDGDTARINLTFGADWWYRGASVGNLTYVRVLRNDTVVCERTNALFSVHKRFDSFPAARVWTDSGGDYKEGTWISNTTIVHLHIGPFRYVGTDHEVVAELHAGMKIESPVALRGIPSPSNTAEWYWSYPEIAAARGMFVDLDVFTRFALGQPGENFSSYLQSGGGWTILVDGAPPTAAVAYPADGENYTATSSPVSVAVRACDKGSGLKTDGATIGVSGPAPSEELTFVGGWQPPTANGSCVDALALVDAGPGGAMALTFFDHVGNKATIPLNITIVALSAVLRFDDPRPAGWTRALDVTLQVHIVAPPGIEVSGSTVEVSLTARPADAANWSRERLTFDPATSTATVLFHASRDGSLYVQWRASTVVGPSNPPPEVRGNSRIFAMGVDTVAPAIAAGGACSAPPGDSANVDLVFDARDNLSGIDLNSVVLLMEPPEGTQATTVSGSATVLTNGTVRFSFTAVVPYGRSNASLGAKDMAGNFGRSAPCVVENLRPIPLQPTWQSPWFLGALLLAAAAAVLAALILRRRRANFDDPADGDEPALPLGPAKRP